jgi:DNA polymerase III alpha subunit (gram-positive type)
MTDVNKYNPDILLSSRPIALIDIETTGLDEFVHEIISIGVLMISQAELDYVGGFHFKVKPEHPERISPEAQKLNGFNEAGWKNAYPLRDAMLLMASKTVNAMPTAFNIGFEQRFLRMAEKKTGVVLQMDYHWIDLPSIAWFWNKVFNKSRLHKFSLDKISKALGVEPEALPHTSESGVLQNYKVLCSMVDKSEAVLKR